MINIKCQTHTKDNKYTLTLKQERSIIIYGEIGMKTKDNILIIKEKEWYIVKSLNNNITFQGKTREEALKNLKEALELNSWQN